MCISRIILVSNISSRSKKKDNTLILFVSFLKVIRFLIMFSIDSVSKETWIFIFYFGLDQYLMDSINPTVLHTTGVLLIEGKGNGFDLP